MNSSVRLLVSLGSLLLGAGCATSPQIGAYQKAIKDAGFVAFNQPVGDVRNRNDWNKYGPGTILRAKNQAYYYPATTVVGNAGLKNASDPQNASPIALFSGRKVSGYDYDGKGGWTLEDVNQISAAIGLKRDTTVELQFGKAYLANPLGEGAMHQALAAADAKLDPTTRQALQNGQFACVQNAVWTDSIRYTFKQSTENNASATYKLGEQEIAALTAKGYKVIDGGVEVGVPTFIAYTPLPNAGQDVAPKR